MLPVAGTFGAPEQQQGAPQYGAPQQTYGQNPASNVSAYGQPPANHAPAYGQPTVNHATAYGQPAANHAQPVYAGKQNVAAYGQQAPAASPYGQPRYGGSMSATQGGNPYGQPAVRAPVISFSKVNTHVLGYFYPNSFI